MEIKRNGEIDYGVALRVRELVLEREELREKLGSARGEISEMKLGAEERREFVRVNSLGKGGRRRKVDRLASEVVRRAGWVKKIGAQFGVSMDKIEEVAS